MKALSLFANIGVAEAYLDEIGIDVVLANELLERRAKLYSEIYPETEMIEGDITNPLIFDQLVEKSLEYGIEVLMATPPCQGMSTAGQLNKNDDRNELIIPVIELIKKVKPKYVFLENVPKFLNTSINYNNEVKLIVEIIQENLEKDYNIEKYIINTMDYGVPQSRERAIILMSSNKPGIKQWELPAKDEELCTLEMAIGHLPDVDPFVKDVTYEELLELFPNYEVNQKQAQKISKWHNPPVHVKRQVEAMMYTPTGASAFNNEVYYPKKQNGERVKGYKNTYKRQRWNRPAYTVTMDNRKISSQENVHPGRFLRNDLNGNAIYSNPRALTLYEIMIIMSLPLDWNLPNHASEAFVRSIIGEGIPPLFVKKTFQEITREFDE